MVLFHNNNNDGNFQSRKARRSSGFKLPPLARLLAPNWNSLGSLSLTLSLALSRVCHDAAAAIVPLKWCSYY